MARASEEGHSVAFKEVRLISPGALECRGDIVRCGDLLCLESENLGRDRDAFSPKVVDLHNDLVLDLQERIAVSPVRCASYAQRSC